MRPDFFAEIRGSSDDFTTPDEGVVDSDVTYCVSTGCLFADVALGGGFAGGRMAEIFGMFGEGKTTISAHALVNAQRRRGAAIFIDKESGIDRGRFRELGGDTSKLILSEALHIEGVCDNIISICNKAKELREAGDWKTPVVIVWDTVNATPNKNEVEGNQYADGMSYTPRLVKQMLKRMNWMVNRYKVTIIFVNQSSGQIAKNKFVPPPNETSGIGWGVKFWSSQRLELRKVSVFKEGDVEVGIKVKIMPKKNRLLRPNFPELIIKYASGVDDLESTLLCAYEKGVFVQAGSWYKMDLPMGYGLKGQGYGGIKEEVLKYPMVLDYLRAKCCAFYDPYYRYVVNNYLDKAFLDGDKIYLVAGSKSWEMNANELRMTAKLDPSLYELLEDYVRRNP